MKQTLLLRAVVAGVFVLAIGGTIALFSKYSVAAPYNQPTVLCDGNACGGGAITGFAYTVVPGTSGSVSELYTGLHDSTNTITNVTAPTGWTATIQSIVALGGPGFVPHGSLASNTDNCQRRIHWDGSANPQSAPFTVGFDSSSPSEPEPHQTEWICHSWLANWQRSVGGGLGPIHTP